MAVTAEQAFEAAVAAAGGEEPAAPAEEQATAEAPAEGEEAPPPVDAPQDDSAEKTDSAPPEPLAAAAEAFEKGDLEALAKALGKEAPKLDNPAFVRMRKAEDAEKRAKADREQQAQLLAEARRMYGPLAKARVAAKKGDVQAIKTLIEGVAQKPLAELLPLLQKTAQTPSEIEELRRELGELRKLAGAKDARYADLEKHAVSKLPGWQDEIEAAVEASYDDGLGDYALTPREAADRIVARARAIAGAAPPAGKTVVKPHVRALPAEKPVSPKEKADRDFQAALLAASVPRQKRK